MVSNLSITSMIIGLLIGVVLPAALAVYLIAKRKFSLSCFLLGIGCFFLFASVIESLLHYYLLEVNKTTSSVIMGSTIIFSLYGAFMAGIFEEVGRFIMMKFFMKKDQEFKDGFMFGLGHGFIESSIIIGSSFLNYIIYSFMINSGSFDSALASVPEGSKAAVMDLKNFLINTSPSIYLLGGFERVLAIIIHIAFSLIVLYGIRNKKIQYLFIAILGHAIVDIPAGLYQKSVISLNFTYICLIISVIILVFVIIKLRKSYNTIKD